MFRTHLLVCSKASLITLNPSEVSSQALTSAARQAEGSLTTGPLVMLSARMLLRQPPLSWTGNTAESAHTHTHRVNNSSYQTPPLAYRKSPASSVSAGYQAALGGRHRNVKLLLVQQKRTGHSYWDRHVADHVLAARSHHLQEDRVIQSERSCSINTQTLIFIRHLQHTHHTHVLLIP